ncbi:MAG: hypothetical protein Q8908_08375 [Bacteroidota bacterium]|nr:hypothetical protein [Bacteroidota bacterium]
MVLYRKGVKLDPTNYLALNNLCTLELHSGELQSALDHLTRAISLKPAFFSARINHAEAEKRLGYHDTALLDYNLVLKHNPHWASVYENRGDVRLLQQDYEGAYDDFCRAIALNPALEDAGLKKQ